MQENSSNKTGPQDVVESQSTQVFQPKEKDSRGEYLSQRAKKLVTAVYLVTNLIPQTDPLRVYIRRYSVKILSFVGKPPVGYSLSESNSEIADLSKKVVEMLEIAFFSGYVSEMNFSVLKTEFDSFINEISAFERFQSPLDPSSLKVKMLPEVNSNKTHIVSPKSTSVRVPNTETKKAPAARGVVDAKKTSRKEAILSIIKKRGTVSIKDVSAVIINCSEKTIQRELMALVEEGTLKKTGDRRWSTYSLAN